MKKISHKFLESLIDKYDGITISEAILALENALSRYYGGVEIKSIKKDGNYQFYKIFYNKFNELKKDVVFLKPSDTKNIEKILVRNLKLYSLQNTLQKINYCISKEKGIVIGEVLDKKRNSYVVATKFGVAILRINDLVLSEKRKGFYNKGSALKFCIKEAKIQKGELKILLSRKNQAILKSDIKDIFTKPDDFYAIDRIIGEKILLFTKNNRNPKKEIIELAKLYRERVRVEVIR
ncbi:hypothetical protein LS72_010180 [Helicobacter apodemus]|uniref:Uncharacterized protein n=1 Tax=Helicobacter apodemus TaxID=135569 RepID=A0A4U8UDM5_9HELI|nr:hypothetical protein [Helicobacter apodemus]TLE13229.1 hypothetical protein LS72_010180 [Helicobacter apodemus]